MGSEKVMEGDCTVAGYVTVDAFSQSGNDNLGDELLVDLDSYLDDINDRLTISRLVSDSVIKGMVAAVEQEAADQIAAKEMEVADLKELFDQVVSSMYSMKDNEDLRKAFDELWKIFEHRIKRFNCGGVLQEKDSEWRWKKHYEQKLQSMVLQSSIQTLMEEVSDCQGVHWKEKLDQISSIRSELDVISKSFSHSETSHLISQGSCEADSIRKTLSNSITSLSLWNGNGRSGNSRTDLPENYDAAQLKHLKKEELVGHFNSIITEMRRDHESTVQQYTEEFFSLKREYLKERDVPHKKDKEFDAWRKRIAQVIVKLDEFLLENKRPPSFSIDPNGFNSLQDKFENLLSENYQLRDSLMAKKEEVKFLTTQLAANAEEKLQHSLMEANMLSMVGDLTSDLVDAHIETAITQDIYKCTLRDIIQDVKHGDGETDLETSMVQDIYDIILKGAVVNADVESTFEIEDSDVEQLIEQGISEVIFRETLRDSEGKLKQMYGEYVIESHSRAALEMNVLENENKLSLEAECIQSLKQDMAALTKTLEDKEKSLIDMSTRHKKEREQLQIATQELDRLREDFSKQQISVFERNKELDLVKGQLEEAILQIVENKANIHRLNEKLEQTLKDLEDVDEQRKMAVALSEEKQASLLLVKSKESELNKLMEAVVAQVQGMLKMVSGFECKVAAKVNAATLRFEVSLSQLDPLLKKAKVLKKARHTCQQRLDRRCDGLQKAEEEVDLLGDEVDKLLSLLEKIYISLDHYSPVLKHYPGVVEVLRLIRRELTGESMKASHRSPC